MKPFTRNIVTCAAIGATTAAVLLVLFQGFTAEVREGGLLMLVVVLGGICGTIVGLLVWLMRPRRPMTKRRLFLTRAVMGGAISLAMLVTIAAVWGGFSGIQAMHSGADPGIGGALMLTALAVLLLGIPTFLLGAVIGGIGALIANWGYKPIATAGPIGEEAVILRSATSPTIDGIDTRPPRV